MQAMILKQPRSNLELTEIEAPSPQPSQVLVLVEACAVCRTDLHVVDGDLDEPKLPLIPGHEIVGRIEAVGEEVDGFEVGDRVGVPWLGWTCGKCSFCRNEMENLCDEAKFTGYTLDGGYAELTVADPRFCVPIPENLSAVETAPFLCAGLIGYRSLRKAGDGHKIGLYGFGAAAHLIAQVAIYQGREVYAFTRPGDEEGQEFARSLGAVWADGSDELPPESLDAAIIFAPVGELVPMALKAVRKGGRVVCGGIHMSDIPSFPYEILWGERSLLSVANLTRRDGIEFMEIAAKAEIQTTIQVFSLCEANRALGRLRDGEIEGAAVLKPESP